MTRESSIIDCLELDVYENAFGILAAKFCVFQQPIKSKPEYVTKIICAAVFLYNYLRRNCNVPLSPECIERKDTDQGNVIPRQRQEAVGFERLQAPSSGHSNHAIAARDRLNNYFMNNGKVACQEKMTLLH
ncbi:hypothetical protein GWK47_034810 [Chionoecetes opilio]|uniref:DDE Tnp4 domain-containing protein n=1 Tax=Chionoecetes opilio TaxID=41210 RepID=A0A8J4YNQ5_CHIOP|nr:hypothetical protein GWK47_034810 [Chionoecetes opilio]